MAKPFQRKKYRSEDANSWERTFGRLMTPFESFVQSSSGSGLLLIACTTLALIVANSPLFGPYQHLLHEKLTLTFGTHEVSLTLHHWVNDGLMAVFFFLVGLEIKHEMMVGELSSFRQALLPIAAAMGGMVVPALIYVLLNLGGEGINGWGVPMATDIAFAIAVLVLLGNRVPAALMTILVALAIVDDLGAVLVIALFYTDSLDWSMLIAALGCFVFMMVMNRSGIRQAWTYGFIAVIMWFFMLFSGVHATIAGVLAALAIPVNSVYNPDEFSRDARKLLDKFDVYRQRERAFVSADNLNSVLHTLSVGIHKAETPLQRLEHGLQHIVYFLIIPLFAFFNAGVPIAVDEIGDVFQNGVPLGIICGLMMGKTLGVSLAITLCAKSGVAKLPEGMNYRHVVGIGMLAGIGFTMSIFIAELAFSGQSDVLNEAKIAILFASMAMGVLGYIWLRFVAGGPNVNNKIGG
ncbi:Na+/H+ antiporter NhaA [Cardiobacteriaceae bacterium TAE3-ERU3]|nr:Na+/H+ antiporter NhaA [Cardiobacteriaceae bacterium TAE3-ERU3]